MSTPYYEDDYVTLYHGDCLEHPEWWVDADVLVTDPPYGMAYLSGWVRDRTDRTIDGDKNTGARDSAFKIWGDGPAILFGRWDIDRPGKPRHRLIWSKAPDPGMGDLSFPWGNSDEEIYVYGSGWKGSRGPNVITCPKPPVNDRPNHPTLVAAKGLQRKAVGVELEERYCEIAARRLSQEVINLWGNRE